MSTCLVMPECCRCCLVEENDMIYVFDILDEFNNKICDLIANCGGIVITENDILSKNICGNCLNDLANAARFRQRCLKTENILQNTTIDIKATSLGMTVDLGQLSTNSKLPENDDVEEIVIERIEEESQITLSDDRLIEFSEDDSTRDDDDPRIEYIIAEDPTDMELQDFDYDTLISSQTSEPDEDIRSFCFDNVQNELDSEQKLVEKEAKKCPRPRSLQLNFVCQQCGAGFALQKNLFKHLVTHQNSELFESNEHLMTHKILHAEVNDSVNQLQIASLSESADLKTSKLQNPKKSHRCSYCDKAFVSNSALTSHVRVHTQERPYPCSFCPKWFRTVGAQELHERRHSGLKPYKCDVCGRGFAESSNLKVHRRTHTKEKPHICNICNRAFARVFLLQIHQRTHTGERPFSCEDCGKPFSQQGDLSAHRRIHTGERPHKCDICGKGFIKSSGLTQHRKKHEKQLNNIRALGILENVDELFGDYDGYENKIVHEDDCAKDGEDETIETIVV